ncbi:MAG: sigma-54 interaction domain-containing protein [Longimicrobiales bacterium]
MQPVVGIVTLSDAFAEAWGTLAGTDVVLVRATAVADLPADVCACVIAAGGTEASAAASVAEARRTLGCEVAVVGADAGHRAAAESFRAGASEYFALPADYEAVGGWITERVARARAGGAAGALALAERERYDFGQIIGQSAGLQAVLERAARLIPHRNATVLLTGETGTGKDLVARAIHYNGPRAAQPFVEINCTAIPASLLEGELFGYERGAFTDAKSAKPGLFEAAQGGTLFLDEIGDMALEAQAKLLRVLEDRRVRRLGSVRSFEIDVRVIVATHVDLNEAVRTGRFRSDLYYRLSVVPIRLPALRHRGDDILLLADRFLRTFAHDYDRPLPTLAPDAERALRLHDWPGNVRELRNVLERAVLLGGARLRAADVVPEGAAATARGTLPFPARMDAIETAAARQMLERFEGNKTLAAEALAISRTRLYRLLREGESPS